MRDERPWQTFGLMAGAVVVAMLSPGCRNNKNLAQHMLDDPAHELQAARCGGNGRVVRPLIIEWPATDRASLEGRLRRGGVIVVHYEGCTVEVLRDCAAPETPYDYIGITRKNDRITIRSADELYVNMPLTAVKLAATLAREGELNVEMALVGNYEAQRSRFDVTDLEGHCDGATHVIGAAQVGAFVFHTGAAAEIGTGVDVELVGGVGASSSASREILNRDGNATACETSSTSDEGPPSECGALLRLELTALDGIPKCEAGTVWNGSACVAETRGGGGDGNGRPASEDDRMARQICETQMKCVSQARGMLPPEGRALEREMNACTRMTRAFLNDYSRPQARKCLADFESTGDCRAFEGCIAGPDLDDDW